MDLKCLLHHHRIPKKSTSDQTGDVPWLDTHLWEEPGRQVLAAKEMPLVLRRRRGRLPFGSCNNLGQKEICLERTLPLCVCFTLKILRVAALFPPSMPLLCGLFPDLISLHVRAGELLLPCRRGGFLGMSQKREAKGSPCPCHPEDEVRKLDPHPNSSPGSVTLSNWLELYLASVTCL